jgi:hypothetical protein
MIFRAAVISNHSMSIMIFRSSDLLQISGEAGVFARQMGKRKVSSSYPRHELAAKAPRRGRKGRYRASSEWKRVGGRACIGGIDPYPPLLVALLESALFSPQRKIGNNSSSIHERGGQETGASVSFVQGLPEIGLDRTSRQGAGAALQSQGGGCILPRFLSACFAAAWV